MNLGFLGDKLQAVKELGFRRVIFSASATAQCVSRQFISKYHRIPHSLISQPGEN